MESAPGGSGNLLWRVTEANAAHYLMGILAEEEGNGFTLGREDPSYQALGQSLNRLPRQSWTPIRIDAIAGQMQIFIGNHALPALHVTDPAPIPQGGIGLGAGFDQSTPGGQWQMCFDNIRVTAK